MKCASNIVTHLAENKSAAPPLLYAAGVRHATRSASGVAAKAVRAFQVFRVDGYSWTTTVPGGERITSGEFDVGGRNWCIDYYPNGADVSKDSDSISLHLRLHSCRFYNRKQRVRAHYKFSLLDLAGNAAYELPPSDSTFTLAEPGRPCRSDYAAGPFPAAPVSYAAEGSACCHGHSDFITREELERRREVLLQDDCLAIRCDVGVVQLEALAVTPRGKITEHGSDDDDSYCDSNDDFEDRVWGR